MQDIWTFEGSILENIVYSKDGVSDEKLNEILTASGLMYFVSSMLSFTAASSAQNNFSLLRLKS